VERPWLNDPDLKARPDWIVAHLGLRTALHAIMRRAGSTCDVPASTMTASSSIGRSQPTRSIKLRWYCCGACCAGRATIGMRPFLREPIWKKHLLKQIKRPIREITRAEETQLNEIEDADFADLRRFAIITGLRRHNLLVTRAQVDFELAIVRVVTKGGVPRILPLSQEAYQILWRRRNHHETHFFTFVAQRTRKCPKTGKEFIKGERYVPVSAITDVRVSKCNGGDESA
jgi:hypothetical protein